MDVDFGMDGHKSANNPPTEADALGLIDAAPLPPTLVLHSGHGLQVWWLLREVFAIETPDERAFLRGISDRNQAAVKALARERGWSLDATADLSRLYRADGTLNLKPNLPPVQARLLRDGGPRDTTDDFDDALPPLPEPRPERGGIRPDDRDEAQRADFRRIVEGCAYLRHCRDDAAALSEPEWHAMMTVVAQCRDGERLAHDLSAPYSGYDEDETQAKYAHARRADMPLRCATIRQDREGERFCARCPDRGRITSPIELGYPPIRLRLVPHAGSCPPTAWTERRPTPLRIAPSRPLRIKEAARG